MLRLFIRNQPYTRKLFVVVLHQHAPTLHLKPSTLNLILKSLTPTRPLPAPTASWAVIATTCLRTHQHRQVEAAATRLAPTAEAGRSGLLSTLEAPSHRKQKSQQ